MKVYSLSAEVPAPEVDYMNYDHAKATAAEEAHQKAVKKYLTDLGYTGKNTGRIYREGVADGYAQYMVAEAPRGSNAKVKFFLVHLPYGDAWQSRTVGYMTKKGILDLIEASDRLDALFRK
jgi:hypothetical protein